MIKCDICKKEITDPKDINVLAMFNLIPKTFCSSCYAKKERGITRHLFYVPKYPINSKLFTIGLFMFTILGFLLLLAFIFNFGEINNKIGTTLRIIFIILLIFGGIWEWVLWFIARARVNAAKSASSP